MPRNAIMAWNKSLTIILTTSATAASVTTTTSTSAAIIAITTCIGYLLSIKRAILPSISKTTTHITMK